MKKIICFIVLFSLLCSCKKVECDINILTDDVQIYDVAIEFNNQSNNKVHVNFIKNNNSTIFEQYEQQQIKNIDLIVGSYNVINTYNFSNFKLFTVNNDYIMLDSYSNRAFLNNFGYLRPYSLDFNVLVALKQTKIPNQNNKITVPEFKNFISSNLKKDKLTYSPILSKSCELEYIFMFGGALQQVENYIQFDTTRNNEIYNSFLSFDKNYNASEEKRDSILEQYVNIPRKYYLKQKIILFDMMPLSQALKLPQDKYQIYFFDKTVCTTFTRNMVAMTKNNINPKLSQSFIDFLLSKSTQTKMFNQSNSLNFTDNNIHIPITMDATDDTTSDYLNLDPIYLANIKEICKNINDPNFINYDTYQKFMNSYRFTKTVINNGQIEKNQLLTNITENMNKKL